MGIWVDHVSHPYPQFITGRRCAAGIDCYLVVDASELPDPACVIEERPEVKAVIIRTVALSVVGWCHCGHFVAVH